MRVPWLVLPVLALLAAPAAASPIVNFQIALATPDPIYQDTSILVTGTLSVAANSPESLLETNLLGAAFETDSIVGTEYVGFAVGSFSGFGTLNPGDSITRTFVRFDPKVPDRVVAAGPMGNLHAYALVRTGTNSSIEFFGNSLGWQVQPGIYNGSVMPTGAPIPEPATLMTMASVMMPAAIAGWRRRRRHGTVQ